MKILVVGGGGREHAIIKKLSESPRKPELYAIPGNGGISELAECFDFKATDIENIIKTAREKKIDIIFIASDDPLAAGLADEAEKAGIKAFGPRKNAAEIEWSKVFSKSLMKKYGIPTAAYESFDSAEKAEEYILGCKKFPVFIKTDGLALGKGAVCVNNRAEGVTVIREMMLDKKFGESGSRIVIEEELKGREVTVLAFTDGKTVKPMVSSKDHKRAKDGDEGLNTGGMGTIAPVGFYTAEIAKLAEERIFTPTIRAMAAEGRQYKGVIYFGLMLTGDGPYVIEYNSRFGDPEAQVVLPLLKTDLIDIIEATESESLESLEIEWREGAAACVIIASGGYPEKYRSGYKISGLDDVRADENAYVYHAGTRCEGGHFYTAGGRVVGVTATGGGLDEALERAYAAAEKIKFEGGFYRRDIGRTKN